MMKKLFLGNVALVTLINLGSSALAADIPVRERVYQEPVYQQRVYRAPQAFGYNWTGFYVGGHAGGAWSGVDWTFFNGIVTERFSQSNSSWLGGGQVGYLHQWGNWVAGIEVSYSATDLKHTSSALLALDRSRNSDIDDLLLVTARFGYASDRWLAYLKGGYANAQMGFDTIVTSTGALTTTSSRRDGGWTVGGGWEFAITHSLSFAVEYDFARIESRDRSQFVFPGFIAPETVTDANADIHAVTARLNWKFGQGFR